MRYVDQLFAFQRADQEVRSLNFRIHTLSSVLEMKKHFILSRYGNHQPDRAPITLVIFDSDPRQTGSHQSDSAADCTPTPEDSGKRLTDLRAEIAGLIESLNKLLADCDDMISTVNALQAELKVRRAEAAQLSEGIDPALMDRYQNRLFNEIHPPLSAVQDGKCSECGSELSDEELTALRHHEGAFLECLCGRLLILR